MFVGPATVRFFKVRSCLLYTSPPGGAVKLNNPLHREGEVVGKARAVKQAAQQRAVVQFFQNVQSFFAKLGDISYLQE